MQFIPTTIPGCAVVRSPLLEDRRGSFLKLYHEPSFDAVGRATVWREAYTSTSRAGVIRGMHFQTPPADHEKLVFCLSGEIEDVVLDLRARSPTFGAHIKVPMRAGGAGLFIPRGCAHGFRGISAESSMLYLVATAYSPANDAGVRWDSFGCDWGLDDPIVSARDAALPTLADLVTPFEHDPSH